MGRIQVRWGILPLVVGLTLAQGCSPPVLGDEPPVAPRSDHVDEYHGVAVADPYRWLEDAETEATREWVAAQDRYARAFVDRSPARSEIRDRIEASARHSRYLPPVERGGRYFFQQVDPSFTRISLLVTEGMTGPDRVLVDADSLERVGQVLDRAAWPSPDGNLVAYAAGRLGSRWMSIRILDVETGQLMSDSLAGFVSTLSSVSWDESGAGFFYDRFASPEAGDSLTAPLVGERIMYHSLGTLQSEDREVMAPLDPGGVFLSPQITDDYSYLVVTARDGTRNTDAVYVLDARTPGARPELLLEDGLGAFTLVGSNGPELWFYTTLDAPNGRIVAVDAGQTGSSASLTDLVAEADIPFDVWTTSGTRGVGDGLIAALREDSRLVVRMFDASGTPVRDVALPYLGSVWSGFLGRQGSDEVFYMLSGFADPGTVYRLDLTTGESTVFRQPTLPYDPSEFVIRQVFSKGPAGDRIPMYLGHHRNVTPDRTHPVIMYGYGFGGWSASPWFRAHMAEWMESGGVFALPALRGGGEYGETWHAAGVRRNRQNGIDDFIAAAEWLIEQEIAVPELLVAETNSAGGSLVAAAVLQRPDLFGAAILAFPVLDLLRYDQFTGAARWRSEFGSTSDADDFAAIHAYSPVHNTKPGSCYPPMFVTPGSRDETTPPLHAYKFVAAVQHAQACSNPALLRVSWEAGHRYGADLTDTVENFADQLSFLAMQLDLPEGPD